VPPSALSERCGGQPARLAATGAAVVDAVGAAVAGTGVAAAVVVLVDEVTAVDVAVVTDPVEVVEVDEEQAASSPALSTRRSPPPRGRDTAS
jgi:hypothetical protein